MSEREICDKLYAWVKDGKRRYYSGEPLQGGSADTVRGLLDLLGWCLEDHRAALMRSNERYCHEQADLEAAGVFGSLYN